MLMRLRTQLSLISAGLLLGFLSPGYAMVPMEMQHVRQAIVYGMEHGGETRHAIMADNWIEGSEGSLLLVYSPFMMIASEVARGNTYDLPPTEKAIKETKAKHWRTIRNFVEGSQPVQVKFTLSCYGTDPAFMKTARAVLTGEGRGQSVVLKPTKTYCQPDGEKLNTGTGQVMYEAMGAFYFPLEKLLALDEMTLTVRFADGRELAFPMRPKHLY